MLTIQWINQNSKHICIYSQYQAGKSMCEQVTVKFVFGFTLNWFAKVMRDFVINHKMWECKTKANMKLLLTVNWKLLYNWWKWITIVNSGNFCLLCNSQALELMQLVNMDTKKYGLVCKTIPPTVCFRESFLPHTNKQTSEILLTFPIHM